MFYAVRMIYKSMAHHFVNLGFTISIY